MSEPERSEGPSDSAEQPRPPPRAFALGTGIVLQTAGVVFVLGALCFWSLSGILLRPAREPEAHWVSYLAGERLFAAALTIGVLTTLVAGIGFIGVGVGLQGERPTSGAVGMVITGAAAIVYWALCVLLMFKAGALVFALIPAAFGVISTVLFLLCGHSRGVLRRHPPPPDQSVVTEEFLEEYRRKREERRRQSGL